MVAGSRLTACFGLGSAGLATPWQARIGLK